MTLGKLNSKLTWQYRSSNKNLTFQTGVQNDS